MSAALSPAEPCLFVGDLPRSLAYFTGTLGFAVVFTWGEPAFYGQVSRDDALLNLRHVDSSPFLPGRREAGELLAASINVGDAAALETLFGEFRDAGADFFRPLKREPWGALTFIVRDPDGNLLLFSGSAA